MPEGSVSADDRHEILDLIGSYIWAVDTGDLGGVLTCFAPGGAVRYDPGERYESDAGLRRFAAKAIGDDTVQGRMHLNFPLFFRRDGETVILTSYLSAARWRPPAPPEAFGSLRHIEDHCVRVGEAWLIRERVIRLWTHETVGALRARRERP